MSDDVLDRLEAQLLEAAARRPARRRTRGTPGLAVAAGILAVLLLAGGLVAVLGQGGDARVAMPADGRGARTPEARTRLKGLPPLLDGQGGAVDTGTTGTTPPAVGPLARFPAQQLTLCATAAAPRGATGVVPLQGGTLSLQASGLRPSNRYLVWFFNGPKDAVPVGFAQYQRDTRTLQGGIQGLPRDAEDYRFVVVTRETDDQISKPTRIVLRSTRITTGRVGRQQPC